MWNCKCECGNICVVSGKSLRNGHTSSCGCKIKSKGENINKPTSLKSKPKDGSKPVSGAKPGVPRPKPTSGAKPGVIGPKPTTGEKPGVLESKPVDTPVIPGVLRVKPGEVYGVVKIKSDKLNKPDDKKGKPTQPETTDKPSDDEEN